MSTSTPPKDQIGIQEISKFIIASKYANYNEKLKRRETWDEICDRIQDMHLRKYYFLSEEDRQEVIWAMDMVRKLKSLPSMRSAQFAGKGVESHNARIYNCGVRHIDSIRAFSECFYLLLCGVGMGFGISKKYISRLPKLITETQKNGTILQYTIEDTIEGWADSIEALLMCYFSNTAFSGRKIVFDYSKIRKKGSKLKTSGGKAPGYSGLKYSHTKIKELLDHLIENKKQTYLRPINAYDILMHCASAVLSGGIRRSATSTLFDESDVEMMNSKSNLPVEKCHGFFSTEGDYGSVWSGKIQVDGKKHTLENISDYDYQMIINEKKVSWFLVEPQRSYSNNSVVLIKSDITEEKIKNAIERTKEYGEPGFVFADKADQLFNPCFEIGFIPVTADGVCGVQFCNLTSINGAAISTVEEFRSAARAATIIGTLQAGYTDFKYLHHSAKELTERESLLGVSITGIMDNPQVLLDAEIQKSVAEYTVEVNREWAKKIGIPPAARVTAIKPEGTSSLVVGSASGIHPHHSRKYFRRVRANKLDNVYQHFAKYNPHATEELSWSATKTDDVVTFPIVIGDQSMVKSDLTALKHLEIARDTQINWVVPGSSTPENTIGINHNVSLTVVVRPDEWDGVVKYLYDNIQFFTAVSFLPDDGDKKYIQAPMEAVVTPEDEQKFNDLINKFTPVDYSLLFESHDETDKTAAPACVGGNCEVTYI